MAEQELQRVRTQIRQEEVCSQTKTSQNCFLLVFFQHTVQVHLHLLIVCNVQTQYLMLYIGTSSFPPTFAFSEQQEHVSSLEDKHHSLRSSLQELQLHGSQQKQTISELQLKNNQQNIEMESLRRRIDELNQVRKPSLHPNGGLIKFQM